MIRYSLTCKAGHAFEGWFSNSAAFDKQVKKKLVSCPTCGATKVEKALMAPSVVTSEKSTKGRRAKVPAVREASVPAVAAPAIGATPEQREMLQQLRKLRDQMLAKSEYVGPRFAEEARRMHENESEARSIHGEAKVEEVKALLEEGIEVFPVPVLPDDQN